MPRPQLPEPEDVRLARRRAQGRASYHKTKVRQRERVLLSRYGITIAEYDCLSIAQGGLCAICRRPPNGHGPLHVDHDHVAGAVRGLLCFSCNYALGSFQDSPAILREAAFYLESPRPGTVKVEGYLE